MCEHCGADGVDNNPHHPTVEVYGVPVDEKLAKLIELLWQFDIRTSSCCQEDGKYEYTGDHGGEPVATISFYDVSELTRFLTLVGRSCKDMRELMTMLDSDGFFDGWRVSMWYQGVLDDGIGPTSGLMPTFDVWFPAEDIEKVTLGIEVRATSLVRVRTT